MTNRTTAGTDTATTFPSTDGTVPPERATSAPAILQTDGTTIGPSFAALLERIRRLNDVGKAAGLMGWDRDVNMPAAASADRAQQMATLAQIGHELLVDERVGDWLGEADLEAQRWGAASGAVDAVDEATEEGASPAIVAELTDRTTVTALLREFRRQRDDAIKLPGEFVARRARLSGAAYRAWVDARAASDWPAFRPHLQHTVDLAREQAGLYGYTTEPYDALLDRYERGMTSAAVERLFDAATAALLPLREAIVRDGRPVSDAVLHQPYSVEQQQAFARHIAPLVGYDFGRGHLGTTVHPFASSFSQSDCRITTRWNPAFISPSLFGTLHECGHAIYEQHTSPVLARTPLARGTSSGIHESQSRMIENIVGRSRGFWRAHFGALQSHFPSQLANTTADDFWRAVNHVGPSFIRVEADELTYNLHIILRFGLERALISGTLAVADARDAWNAAMEDVLDMTPPDDAHGILQDVHWSSPMFGYFPTYALGNLYAAQLYEAATAADPTVAEGLNDGNVLPLLVWLHTNVHRYGKVYPPAELIVRATGHPLDEGAFVRYADAKFGDGYGLG